MRIHRFILELDINQKHLAITDAEFINQARNVLRFKKDDQIILCDGQGSEAVATIITMRKGAVEVEISSIVKNENESEKQVVLYCAILKKENFELVIQKAVEVGVKEIVPLLTKRTVKLDLKYDRLQKIIKEAAEQSGRGIMPTLQQAQELETALQNAKNNDGNFFFDQSGEVLKKPEDSHKSIGIFIGPEGGWEDSEIKLAKEYQCKIVTLGNLTLRAETAVIVASFSILHGKAF